MKSTADTTTQLIAPLAKLVYEMSQQGKAVFSLAHKNFAMRIGRTLNLLPDLGTQSIPAELSDQILQSRDALLAQDWYDAEVGIYPMSLLLDSPWQDFIAYYPMMWVDMTTSVWALIRERQHQKFSESVDTEGYPHYYLQNFHNQTDGYLSDLSANLYDLQVEILFNGIAEPMRRRILAPLKAGLNYFSHIPQGQRRVLDIACGTGRTLRSIRFTLPKALLHGVDLSAAYLRKANELLSELEGELPQLLQANGEELPYVDEYFQGVTCVFTFHELPPTARQNVIAEAYRVLQPGGIFIICDSVQAIDMPEFIPLMENFPLMFHEPYYKHYIQDDLVKRLQSVGFTDVQTENHCMSKYWIAIK